MTGSANATILIPAAGDSSRMRGRDKLLETIEGESILRRTALRACESDAREIIVVIRGGQSARRTELQSLEVKIVESEAPAEGMAGSLKCGVAAASKNASALMILLPDMPEIDASDINEVLNAFEEGKIIRAASENSEPGHPVLIPRILFADVAGLEGDTGAKELLEKYAASVRLVRRPGTRALLDLDTPEEWERWRQANL